MNKESLLPELEKVLEPLDEEARNTVLLEVSNTFTYPPPILRTTVTGDEGGSIIDWATVGYYNQTLDVDKVETMMKSGQIAYPMAMKKAPAISIVNSESGFRVTSPDESLARIMHANMREVLPRCIDEILTFQEYGAYHAEVTWEPAYPQDYGLTKSPIPFWVISDMHGCHPSTIARILRDEKTRSFRGFEQAVNWRPETVKVGLDRALVISNNGVFGNIEGQSILEQVYVWWFWYELIWRSLLRYLQRCGDGVVLVKAPSRGKVMVNNTAVDAMNWAMQLASSLRKTNSGVMPSDVHRDTNKELWGVELVRTGDEQAGRHFVEALNLLSDNINRYLLTGDPAGEDDEFAIMLDTERMLSHVATHLNRYVLRKALRWNGSSAAKLWIEFQGANSRVLPLLFKLMAVAGNTVGDALANVNWRELFTKGGVPILSEEDVEEIKRAQEKAKGEAAQRQFGEPPREEAKGQRGGEGSWAARRDKEGEPEKLELPISGAEIEYAEVMKDAVQRVASALSLPVIALTEPQVNTLKEMGVYDDGEPVVLFNPYHDKEGKFTEKMHAAKPLPDEKIAVDEKVDQKSAFRAADAVSLAYERMGEKPVKLNIHKSTASYTGSVCGKNLVCRKVAGKSLAVYSKGEIHLGPRGVKAIAKDRQFGEYMLAHEVIHSRKRSTGKNGVDLSHGLKPNDAKWAHATRISEEGLTDLLARRMTGVGSDYWMGGRAAYLPNMGAIAIIVGEATNWNKAEAWALIDQLHYHINDPEYWNKVLQDAIGAPPAGDWEDGVNYFALMKVLQARAGVNNYKALGWLFEGEK